MSEEFLEWWGKHYNMANLAIGAASDAWEEATSQEYTRLAPILREAEEFVCAIVGENQPSRAWAIELRKKLSAILATQPQDQER